MSEQQLTLEELFGERGHRHHRSIGTRAKRQRRRNVLVAIICVAVLVAVPVFGIGGLALWFEHAYSANRHLIAGDAFPSGERPPASADGAQNILLLGSDTRGTLGDIESGKSTDERSDTIMLVHIPADHADVEVISIMRDLWVPIPGHGEAKINAALSYGGVPLVVQTVESLLGARIDHVAAIDFAGFAQMSTALGGVTVESPKTFASKNMPGYSFSKGPNTVAGKRALAFVRERYAFPDSDYQRVRDQQSFMQGVIENVTSVTGVNDVPKLHAFITTTSRYVAVDKGLTAATGLKIALQLRNVRAKDVHFFTLPTLGTGTADGQSVVTPDPVAIAGIGKALDADELLSYISANPPKDRP